MRLSKKHFFFGLFIGIGIFVGIIQFVPDGKLHIYFCDVGQGDAIYIRFPDNKDMLIDGGPNDQVLSCLGRHMPFYDRTIDLVAATHPQKDHIGGLLSVVKRYQVKYFLSSESINLAEVAKSLVTELQNKQVPIKYFYSGQEIKLDNVSLKSIWPDGQWVAYAKLALGNDVLGTTTDVNGYSLVILLKYGQFKTLFTGDADVDVQKKISDYHDLQNLTTIDVLKVPHHGAKTAISNELLDILKPQLSIISVGKNSYGHPAKNTIDLLSQFGKVLRTDQQGDIEVVSNGNNYAVISDKR